MKFFRLKGSKANRNSDFKWNKDPQKCNYKRYHFPLLFSSNTCGCLKQKNKKYSKMCYGTYSIYRYNAYRKYSMKE